MSRIVSNVPSLTAQRVLSANNASLNTSLERLSTGLRINRGKDDPAGLIASENLRSELAGTGAAIGNAERADQVVNIAEGALQELSTLLEELQALITENANVAALSDEERAANQQQVDSILRTIDRIADSASFQGLRLLNGNLDYEVDNISGNVDSFKINAAKLPFGQTMDVDVVVTQSAQVGGFVLSFGNANINLGGAGASDGADSLFRFEVAGVEGARELSFASGSSVADIISAINSVTDLTGVTATASGASGIRLESIGMGADDFVRVQVLDDGGIDAADGVYRLTDNDTNRADIPAGADAFNASTVTNGIEDDGQDATVTVNGVRATVNGTVARVNTEFLDVEIDLSTGTAGLDAEAQRAGTVTAFRILGGGADFQLASRVNLNGKVSLGIPQVTARTLGRAEVFNGSGYDTFTLQDLGTGRDVNIEDGNLSSAQRVVSQAIEDVTKLRGRLGAFQANTVSSTIRSLQIAFENTTAAESVIRDTDFAAQTARLSQLQILNSSSTSSLAIANSQPQSVLQLLG
ncbi:MAG: flagellin [Planctomycetota bacterium]